MQSIRYHVIKEHSIAGVNANVSLCDINSFTRNKNFAGQADHDGNMIQGQAGLTSWVESPIVCSADCLLMEAPAVS